MAKDPAFLFYSQDFFLGVATMSFEDRGKYITLLTIMHQQGRMNIEDITSVIGAPSTALSKKFAVDEQGMWYNVRLETEIENRRSFIETRRSNGKLGGRPKGEIKPLGYPKGKPLAKPNEEPIAPPKEDEDEIDNNSYYILIGEERVYISATYSKDSVCKFLIADTEMMEAAAKVKKCDAKYLKPYLDDFISTNKLSNEFSTDTYGKIRTHFANWIKKQTIDTTKQLAKEEKPYNIHDHF